MSKKTVLEVKNLTKKFDDFTAVSDLTFTLGAGEILGVLGQNGAGKTTTIQMLLGVLTPSSGSIRYFGKELWEHRSEIMERVGFSSTYVSLPDLLTVRESLTFVSYLYTMKDRHKRMDEIVSQFHLESLLDSKNNELSAGQKTRVNLAKAFLHKPSILLLDEPTASLDPDIALEIRNYLLELRKKIGISVIITSHNMNEVEQLCDRVLVIQSGTCVAENTPLELAKSTDICRVELLTLDWKNLIAFCKETGLAHKRVGNRVTVELHERDIANFMQSVSKLGITYDEIGIEKPTLEDYFLRMAQQTKPL